MSAKRSEYIKEILEYINKELKRESNPNKIKLLEEWKTCLETRTYEKAVVRRSKKEILEHHYEWRKKAIKETDEYIKRVNKELELKRRYD